MNSTPEHNRLFPVFFKLEELRVLLVGAGNVGLEKLRAILENSPSTEITIVAPQVRPEIFLLASTHSNLKIQQRKFLIRDLQKQNLVFIAVNDLALSKKIADKAHAKNLLVNVADKPALCDFYLSSIVRKGNLKIAISTNGQSPTLAKRLKEIFRESIPDETELSIGLLNQLRNRINGDFREKVKILNEATKVLLEKQNLN